MQPFLREVKRSLPDIPLWNPWITAGRPLHADAQSAIFSPFNAPAYVMDEWRALALIAALKLWVAAFGMFLLARALSMRWPGALPGRSRLRLQPVDGHVDLLSARERVGARAVGAAGGGGGAATPDVAAARRCWRS